MKKRFNIRIKLEVDDEANFWEVDRKEDDWVIKQLLQDMLYDIDDAVVKHIEVKELG